MALSTKLISAACTASSHDNYRNLSFILYIIDALLQCLDTLPGLLALLIRRNGNTCCPVLYAPRKLTRWYSGRGFIRQFFAPRLIMDCPNPRPWSREIHRHIHLLDYRFPGPFDVYPFMSWEFQMCTYMHFHLSGRHGSER